MLRLQGASDRQIARDWKAWKAGEAPWLAAARERCPPVAVYPENLPAFVVFTSLLGSQWIAPGEGSCSYRLPLETIERAARLYVDPVLPGMDAATAARIEHQVRDLVGRITVMVSAAKPVLADKHQRMVERAREDATRG